VNGGTKKNFDGREFVIYQNSDAADKSPYKEHCMMLFNKKYIKRGWFSLNFYAPKEGIVGIIFKYIDSFNYYILEIGGAKKENQFFQIKKKVRGMMKTIKRLNSLEEIPLEERNKSLDFGYTLFTWFSVRVVVNLESVKVFYKKNGFSEKMIFDIEDPDLDYGIVGIGTFATPVAFDNIMLRPIVNEENPNFSPDDIPPSINPEEDLFFYNLTGNKVNDECGITVEEDVDDHDPNAPSGAGSESGMGSKKRKKRKRKEKKTKKTKQKAKI